MAVREDTVGNVLKPDTYITLHQSSPKEHDEAEDLAQTLSALKGQLRQAEEMAQNVQKEVRGVLLAPQLSDRHLLLTFCPTV